MSSRPIRLLLVDDHAMVRMGLAAMLQAEPDLKVVGEAADAAQALARERELRPDVTLMDVRLPGGSGIEALRRIKAERAAARVLMLTTFHTEEEIHAAIEAGACGYLLKTITREELARAIRQVHAGETCMPTEVAAQLAERRSSPDLTPREREVLAMMVKGLTNRDIGRVLNCSENTTKTHLKHIFFKLNVADRAEATATAIQRGLVFLD
jgi:DNA-binding NarL/FixJ family response regulator